MLYNFYNLRTNIEGKKKHKIKNIFIINKLFCIFFNFIIHIFTSSKKYYVILKFICSFLILIIFFSFVLLLVKPKKEKNFLKLCLVFVKY